MADELRRLLQVLQLPEEPTRLQVLRKLMQGVPLERTGLLDRAADAMRAEYGRGLTDPWAVDTPPLSSSPSVPEGVLPESVDAIVRRNLRGSRLDVFPDYGGTGPVKSYDELSFKKPSTVYGDPLDSIRAILRKMDNAEKTLTSNKLRTAAFKKGLEDLTQVAGRAGYPLSNEVLTSRYPKLISAYEGALQYSIDEGQKMVAGYEDASGRWHPGLQEDLDEFRKDVVPKREEAYENQVRSIQSQMDRERQKIVRAMTDRTRSNKLFKLVGASELRTQMEALHAEHVGLMRAARREGASPEEVVALMEDYQRQQARVRSEWGKKHYRRLVEVDKSAADAFRKIGRLQERLDKFQKLEGVVPPGGVPLRPDAGVGPDWVERVLTDPRTRSLSEAQKAMQALEKGQVVESLIHNKKAGIMAMSAQKSRSRQPQLGQREQDQIRNLTDQQRRWSKHRMRWYPDDFDESTGDIKEEVLLGRHRQVDMAEDWTDISKPEPSPGERRRLRDLDDRNAFVAHQASSGGSVYDAKPGPTKAEQFGVWNRFKSLVDEGPSSADFQSQALRSQMIVPSRIAPKSRLAVLQSQLREQQEQARAMQHLSRHRGVVQATIFDRGQRAPDQTLFRMIRKAPKGSQQRAVLELLKMVGMKALTRGR